MPAEYGISSLHIIESLGTTFNEPGKELMRRLQLKGGKLKDFPITYHEGFGRAEIFKTLTEIYDNEARLGLVPILHFECHGDASGIQLRDGTTIYWTELAQRFRAFNIASRFNLLVVLACCDGIHQIQVLTIHDMCPFSAVVGCEGKIYTSELLNGYERFYEILVNDGKALRAEAALQAAVTESAGTQFRLFSAERAFGLVYANVNRINYDPDIRRERIAFYRRELDRMRALNGTLTPSTDAEVDAYLQQAEEKTLREFFGTFFACRKMPENVTRFDYASIARRALAAARTGGSETVPA
jgi:hypothetical protein